MDDGSSDSEANLYRVDTTPPPPGEGDAYSAPTRVGTLAKSHIDQIFESARDERSDVEKAYAAISQASGIRPTPSLGGLRRSASEVASLCDRDEDEPLEATVLSERMQAALNLDPHDSAPALELERVPAPPALPTPIDRARITLPPARVSRATSASVTPTRSLRRNPILVASVVAALVATCTALYWLFTMPKL
ncbi:hypothetical protein AKJ09_10440 [Labilithrix luteola]|uniref:Uncharacterized protein n=2 Tax=Labilithrix luteola TaxID=1391654 RepID=A0A0K1QDQ1_9BACT|nr:hypothetical protein AKJ09_10440 [Labilithrix luteola]